MKHHARRPASQDDKARRARPSCVRYSNMKEDGALYHDVARARTRMAQHSGRQAEVFHPQGHPDRNYSTPRTSPDNTVKPTRARSRSAATKAGRKRTGTDG